ncbi:hypothetical protein SOPP22_12285 [Shewanella sp. OPT22]|nr:hypothetical protein SOPP22_12285 [Shewanella sp. OPT22]
MKKAKKLDVFIFLSAEGVTSQLSPLSETEKPAEVESSTLLQGRPQALFTAFLGGINRGSHFRDCCIQKYCL